MLPNEYQPLKLTERQQAIYQRYTALGFKIAERPFAGRGENLYFFLNLPSPDNPKGLEFTIDIHTGTLHQTGTHQIWKIHEAEAAFGERKDVSPPSSPAFVELPAVSPPSPAPVVAAAAPLPPPAEVPQERPAEKIGGLTPSRSPKAPTAKKQTSLF